MKLLFIANSRIPTERAMGTAIMKQCEAFARAGVDVTLVIPSRENMHHEDPFLYHGVTSRFRLVYLPSFDFVSLGKNVFRFSIQKITFFIAVQWYVWHSDADIVYSREPELIAPLITRKKKYVELHHFYGLRKFGKVFLRFCSGVIVLTSLLRDDVHTHFGVPFAKMIVAPSGIDIAQFENVETREMARTRLGVETQLPIALYIGALEEWKGYKTFLEASRFLVDEVQCVVIGGDTTQVATLSAEYPAVQFLGQLPQKDLPDNQQIADVLVIPNSAQETISARHTSPLKLFAHMASGIPIVASHIPSLMEVLSNKNSLLVESDNCKSLTAGILYTLNEKPNSATIAMQAQKDVQKYDWSRRTSSVTIFINETSSKTHI